jgi:hypothetical protein
MILAKDPTPNFVASIVEASEEGVQVLVTSKNGSAGGGGTCGDSLGEQLSPGWPQIYNYDLVENYSGETPSPVVDLDDDQIGSRRFKQNGPWGSCSGVQLLDPSTRHRLIAHWLGVRDNEMQWQPVEYVSITWTNKIEFQQKPGATITSRNQKLQDTVAALRRRGFLTADETAKTAPRLVVTIKCDIEPSPLV